MAPPSLKRKAARETHQSSLNSLPGGYSDDSSDDDEFDKMLTQKSSKKNNDDDDEEEEEKEEEDFGSDSDEEEEEDEDIFGDDDSDEDEVDATELIADKADEEYLENLPDLEREMILAERYDKKVEQNEYKKVIREEKLINKKKKETATKTKPAPKKAAPKKAGPVAAAATTKKGKVTRSSTRNADISGTKTTKKAALDQLALRKAQAKAKAVQSDSESDDYGDSDSDDDDQDDDFANDGGKKIVKGKGKSKSASASVAGSSLLDNEYDDSQEDDNDESAAGSGSSSKVKEELAYVPTELTFEDFAKYPHAVFKRRVLEENAIEPFFNDVVVLGYVRYGIGFDKDNSTRVYRLCKIVDVVEGSALYKFPTREDTPIVKTKKRLVLDFAGNVKEFDMMKVSDEQISLKDFTVWSTAMKNARKALPSMRDIKRASKQIKDTIMKYKKTDEEVESAAEWMRKNNPEAAPRRNMTSGVMILESKSKQIQLDLNDEITELKELKEVNPTIIITDSELKENENDDDDMLDGERKEIFIAMRRVNKSQKALADIQDEIKSFGKREELRIQKHLSNKKMIGWDKVNNRNRGINSSMDYNKYKENAEDEEKKKGRGVEYNPFARRPNKPKILWDVGGKTTSDTFLVNHDPVIAVAAAKVNMNYEDYEGVSQENAEAEARAAEAKNQQKKAVAVTRTGMSLKDYMAAKKAGATFQ